MGIQSASQVSPNDLADSGGDSGRAIVLPRSYYQPPGVCQVCVRICIPTTIGVDLVLPELGIRLWPRRVEWAPVPKATVDEDRNPGPPKHDVRAARRARQRLSINGVSKTACMEKTSNAEFGRRVTPKGRLHPLSNHLRGR